MARSPSATRHLIFLAHLWACTPFLVAWVFMPEVRREIPEADLRELGLAIPCVLAYLIVRTVLAYKKPDIRWEYVYPPIDVVVVSLLIYLGNRDPLSNVALLYLIPVVEAAGTLELKWAAAVGALVFVGVALATNGLQTADPFNTWFRYFLMLLLASLITSLASTAAQLREQLGVARDRNRIAMEMHDGVQGHLIGVASQLELAQRLAGVNPVRSAEVVGESRDLARLAADEIRFLVQRMRAPTLALGFLPALKQYAHNLCERNGIALVFEQEGEVYDLGPECEHAMFRIAQEAIANVVKHAEATQVEIRAGFEAGGVRLVVRDNGRGFEGSIVGSEGLHAGLSGMRSRAEENGGQAVIRSKVGEGTRVEAFLPRRSG